MRAVGRLESFRQFFTGFYISKYSFIKSRIMLKYSKQVSNRSTDSSRSFQNTSNKTEFTSILLKNESSYKFKIISNQTNVPWHHLSSSGQSQVPWVCALPSWRRYLNENGERKNTDENDRRAREFFQWGAGEYRRVAWLPDMERACSIGSLSAKDCDDSSWWYDSVLHFYFWFVSTKQHKNGLRISLSYDEEAECWPQQTPASYEI